MLVDFKNDGTAKVIIDLCDGTVSTKIVDTASICKALASDTIEVNMKIPKNCRHIIDRGRRRGYLFIYDGCINDIVLSWTPRDISKFGSLDEYIPDSHDQRFKGYNVNNLRMFRIPFPPLCIITLGTLVEDCGKREFNFNGQYAYALSTTNMPLEMTTYYRYPFTNVFNSGHNCCMGHDILGIVPESNVDYFPTMLYTSIGNHDLDVCDGSHWMPVPGGILGNEITTQYELISKLGTRPEIKEFPCQYLKRIGTNVTNLFENIIGGN